MNVRTRGEEPDHLIADPAVTSEVLSIRGLGKSYRLGETLLPVLAGLDLAAASGEMVVVMGPSGSGKTTLLNCISAIDAPDEGQVAIGGTVVDYESERERTLLRRHRVGIVFQFFNLIPTLTVHENVALPLLIAGTGSARSARIDELLEQVGLAQRASHYPFQLSGGEMQLASLARALVHEPELLLADEPTGNVNPNVGRSIMSVLRRLTTEHGTGVLMVTHSPEHAAWADRICFLKEGCIADELAQGRREGDVSAIHRRLLDLEI
jgi:putative ABC transport system ATP-binding protein